MLNLRDAAAMLSITGKPVESRTLRRWIVQGLKVKGQVIRLQAENIGKQWYTTESAIAEFNERIATASKGSTAGRKARPAKHRQAIAELTAAWELER